MSRDRSDAGLNGAAGVRLQPGLAEEAVGSDEIVESGFDASRFPDNFYPGLLVYLDRARARGRVRSFSGREIEFQFPFLSVVGAPIGGRAPGLELLREGDEIGFDVGWTSKGLRVTRINPAPMRRRDG
jgi:hypothetical protein